MSKRSKRDKKRDIKYYLAFLCGITLTKNGRQTITNNIKLP